MTLLAIYYGPNEIITFIDLNVYQFDIILVFLLNFLTLEFEFVGLTSLVHRRGKFRGAKQS
jgi:hypothetical protein